MGIADVGRTIKRLRKERKWTQAELTRRASLATGTISKIEQGERSPMAGTVESTAQALGVDPSQLYGGEMVEEPPPVLPSMPAVSSDLTELEVADYVARALISRRGRPGAARRLREAIRRIIELGEDGTNT